MADSTPSRDSFDVERIQRLVELMDQYGLSEIVLRQGDSQIKLRRGSEPSVTAFAPQSSIPPRESQTPMAAVPMAASRPAPAAEEHVALINSPMVGTFYAAPDPDSPAYVKVGDVVGPETIVCIVEAMKVFNQIPAEVSGRVLAVLVENGEPVEFGQPLFKIDTQP